MSIDIEDIKKTARGRWPEILTSTGIDPGSLDGRHHPCPKCGGTDRFRRRGSRTVGALKIITAEKRAAVALLDCIADAFGGDVPDRSLRDDLLGEFSR